MKSATKSEKTKTIEFLSGPGRPAAFHAIKAIAERHGAIFRNPTIPGRVIRYWFECPDCGPVLNERRIAAIRAALAEERIKLPGLESVHDKTGARPVNRTI